MILDNFLKNKFQARYLWKTDFLPLFFGCILKAVIKRLASQSFFIVITMSHLRWKFQSCSQKKVKLFHRHPTNSPVCYVFSFRIFGDLENYTFLESLGPTESEKQCLHFFQAPYGSHLGFSKWPPIFTEIRQYLSF